MYFSVDSDVHIQPQTSKPMTYINYTMIAFSYNTLYTLYLN
jgi:hypothetical protein